jgi:tRNA-specific 2-thiouridylase
MEKILVALSGGVDSSVAAALLLDRGYRVEGATMQFEGVGDEDLRYARDAARVLGIKYRRFDLTLPYHNMIIKDFVREYRSGRTPNPCVRCNQYFKFGFFLRSALALGFDRIATGHYARVAEEEGRFLLKRGRDRNEQSYFLYRLNQAQLSKTLFPLGDVTKDEVRRIARELRLPTAERSKSQDICFLRGADYHSYLKKILPENPGAIVDKNGRVIGWHKGVVFYTIGQRRRIGISGKGPLYVTKIIGEKNIIQVGDEEDVYRTELIAGNVNYPHRKKFLSPSTVTAKPRYRSPLSPAKIIPFGNKVRVVFEKPQWALTPGQSVVFYRDEVLLGGGIIETVVG